MLGVRRDVPSAFLPGDTPIMRFVPHVSRLEEGFPIPVDGQRVDRVVSGCARALYFHETCKKFSGRVKVIAPFMSYGLVTTDNAFEEAMALAKAFLSSAVAKGKNPEVFFYKFARGPKTGLILLCFYGGTDFLVQLDER